ncbi:MAG: hypothetical protein KDI31_11370 [Pseudomonadales bacterium]|nr:hypothetical protein [Pseudomonadales bacterium]
MSIREESKQLRRDAIVAAARALLRESDGACVSRDGGPEFQFMISGPRFLLWKGMLRSAIESGQLKDEVDVDVLTITIGQLLFAGTCQWSQGLVSLREMLARARFGVSTLLLAIAADSGQPLLRAHMQDAQSELQNIWRAHLTRRLQEGTLDEQAQILLADQLQRFAPEALNTTGRYRTGTHKRKTV